MTSRVGSITVSVEICDEVAAEVVSLPHRWGYNRPGTRLGIDGGSRGADVGNPADVLSVDPRDGNAVLNGVPVRVEPEVGPTGSRG